MWLTFVHVLAAALWFGTAATLPFWGNRMNRADHLHTVLGIMDTVYVLKCVFIMGGLVTTFVTGALLTERHGLPWFAYSGPFAWLAVAQTLILLIAFNSCVLLYLMTMGRRGRRSHFRYVPPIGYNNIALIVLVYVQMTLRPGAGSQIPLLFVPLALLAAIDLFYVLAQVRRVRRLRRMSAEAFARHYFGLMREENMTELFRLFHDDAEFHDPFATGPVVGIRAIERFFQSLGEQFEDIAINPVRITGDRDTVRTEWRAEGTTRNGLALAGLSGTNVMRRRKGRIQSVHIDFDLARLPQLKLVDVRDLANTR